MSQSRKLKNTADLIVCHAEEHITTISKMRDTPDTIFSVVLFSFTGLLTISLALKLVSMARQATTPAFFTENAQNYTAQQAFYMGNELHAVASNTAAIEAVHAAAQARSILPTVWMIGAFFVIGVLYLLERNGFFTRNRADFTIRRIK